MDAELTRAQRPAGTMVVMTDLDSNRPRRIVRLLVLLVAVLVIGVAAAGCWVLGELVGPQVASVVVVVVGAAVVYAAAGRRRGGGR